MAKNKTSDEQIKAIRDALGAKTSGGFSEIATESANKEKGILAKLKKYREVSQKERVAKGYKTDKGGAFRDAGFDQLGDFIEKFFDVRSSKEEQEEAKKELGIKDKKIGGGAGLSISSSKQLLKRLKTLEQNIAIVKDNTDAIRDKISPKKMKVKSGDKETDVMYDPLTGSFFHASNLEKMSDSSEFKQSAIKKVSYALNKERIDQEKKSFKDPKEAAAFGESSPLAKAMAASDSPLTLLRLDMNKGFKSVLKAIKDAKTAGGIGGGTDIVEDAGDLVGAGQKAGKVGTAMKTAARFLKYGGAEAAVGVAAVGTVMYGAYKMASGQAQKEVMDKNVDAVKQYGMNLKYKVGKGNMPTNIQYELNGKSYKFEDLPEDYQTIVLAVTGDGRDAQARAAQERMKKNPKKYQAIAAAAGKGEELPVAATWDGLEKELHKWLAETWPDRNERKAVAGAFLDYFDEVKKKGGTPPTLKEFVDGSGISYVPGTPKETAPAAPPPPPKAAAPAPAPSAPAPPAAAPSAPPAPAPAAPAPSAAPSAPAPPAAAPSAPPAPAPAAPAPSAAPSATPTGKISPTQTKPKTISASQGRDALIAEMDKRGITDPTQRAAMMAQFAEESGGFTTLSEDLRYSSKGLLSSFSKYFPNIAATLGFVGDPVKIADKVYGGRMGNAPEGSGEGWEYRGRGFVQITGKDNYKRFGISNPDALLNPQAAAKASVDYMTQYKGDWSDVKALTRFVNGGYNGLEGRKKYFAAFQKDPSVIGGSAPAAGPSPSSSGTASPSPTASSPMVASTAKVSPAPSSSGTAMDTGTRQMQATKEAAASPASAPPVMVASTAAAPSKQPPPAKPPQAGTRPSDSSFNRALAKDYSHPTAFTTVGTV